MNKRRTLLRLVVVCWIGFATRLSAIDVADNPVVTTGSLDAFHRYCYVCSGEVCMTNPRHPHLSPGRVKCHEVDEYCLTQVRYIVKNESMGHSKSLSADDYTAASVSRACAKTYLGNLCRRDWLGAPHITCISTCDRNFCNCDTRSPPPAMFEDGKVGFESPNTALFYSTDYASCRAAGGGRGVGGKRRGANRVPAYQPDDHRRHENGGLRKSVNMSAKNSNHVGTSVILAIAYFASSH
ncbi:hypothetical protein LSAT2_010119 [Lamellibrachia satsuma]|nr:hypothetical protein LSAT2_010119 [Lamellibrachia satsuma]